MNTTNKAFRSAHCVRFRKPWEKRFAKAFLSTLQNKSFARPREASLHKEERKPWHNVKQRNIEAIFDCLTLWGKNNLLSANCSSLRSQKLLCKTKRFARPHKALLCVKTREISCAGFVFSLDAGIAMAITISMLFLVLVAGSQTIREKIRIEKNLELWKNTLFFADSLVKNGFEEAGIGSAMLDLEKRRTRENEIDALALQKISGFSSQEFEIKKIKAVFEDGEKTFFEKQLGKNCVAIERIVLLEGKTARLVAVGCNG